MDRRGALLLCSLLLIAAGIQGLSIGGKRRCLCPGKGSNSVKPQSIQKIEVFPKSSSCEHVEVIITLKKSGKKRCLDPNAIRIQKMIAGALKQRLSKSHLKK
ncbi:C-X-C motif chemokine 10-like [Rhinatrema bivittatum]|uniref:C-X-C motif chemokine 10-like n=1 Tax=Rhinatrema bivittatum TaxID=194408 RepID=UPI0011296E51|nr:C-X-C motif chemokine 10-like [Rhinatrema bivittatum]